MQQQNHHNNPTTQEQPLPLLQFGWMRPSSPVLLSASTLFPRFCKGNAIPCRSNSKHPAQQNRQQVFRDRLLQMGCAESNTVSMIIIFGSSTDRRLTALFVLSLVLTITYLTTTYKPERNLSVSSVHPSSIAFWAKLTLSPRAIQCKAESKCGLAGPWQPQKLQSIPTSSCPAYFQWIYEDLSPWLKRGISENLILRGKSTASFRVVIVDGRLFIEAYRPCFQTRALFTVWGMAQLLRHYPGLVPNVDLLFSCEDLPEISRRNRRSSPSPIFRYCSNPDFYDIPFPDWSFWGWSEINLRSWDKELRDIVNGSEHIKWSERDPTAYWKGNPFVAPLRQQLLKCNSSDFGAQIFIQNWIAEGGSGFAQSKLSEQCRNRYKIYAEGWGWSASLKYILACDSPVLLINPKYYDFFLRGLIPQQSFWPLRPEQMCKSIKFAVKWGNTHSTKAEAIGKAGQLFISREVSMSRVYDYMLHLLSQYARLLTYQPSVPTTAQEVCTDSILCFASPSEKPFLQDSQVMQESPSPPCRLDPRDPKLMRRVKDLKEKNQRAVEEWEKST